MADSTENVTTPKSTKSRNSNPSIHIQISPKPQCEFVPSDAVKIELLDWVDFNGVAFSMESVILLQES